jgi:hypothetical protein
MHTQVVSVCELKEHWAKVDALAVGEWIGVIPLARVSEAHPTGISPRSFAASTD